MDITTMLSTAKTEALREIGRAAAEGRTADILSGGKRLEEIEELARRAAELEAQVTNVLSAKEFVPPATSGRSGQTTPHALEYVGAPGRDGGERARVALVAKLAAAGVAFQRVRGAIYKTPSGALVGIAYATERQSDRWFLGLTEGRFDHALLLCEEEPGRVHALVLPRGFFEEHGKSLSRSKGGLKFNVVRSGPSFFVTVPAHGHVPVERLSETCDEVRGF
ncbi:MAG: hypothetical protein HZB55_16975 [Deltaproteobacteria bacterium]|nr:hypothetical protein [Deltaproteobacteria bacterium]